MACFGVSLLKHYLRTVQVEVSESVFWALISYFKSQARNPKGQTTTQVSDH